MFLSEQFLPILIQANQTSRFICGQIFSYSSIKPVGFQVSQKRKTKIGYQLRCLFFVGVAIEGLYRMWYIMTTQSKNSYMGSSRLETSLCVMVTVASVLVAERYRVREKYCKEYVTYYNSLLVSESKCDKGLYNFFRVILKYF